MRKVIYLIYLCFIANYAYPQGNQSYIKAIGTADSLFILHDYKNAAPAFSLAFKINNWKGTVSDRYTAASAWALINRIDSAFDNLYRIANPGKFSDLYRIKNDKNFSVIMRDKRWSPLIEIIKANKEKYVDKLDTALIKRLDTIFLNDQKYRSAFEADEKKYGINSDTIKTLIRKMKISDLANSHEITAIIDKHGWLGEDRIGERGNRTLFLIIQHAELKIREKYLPMLRLAVKRGDAKEVHLALLEDRVALDLGKKQIYGSQIGQDLKTGLYYVLPLYDPDNVDDRRKKIGLPPLGEYVKNWNIVWSLENYKNNPPSE